MFVLQWLRGLQALGHHALFVNFVAPQPAKCLAAAQEYFARVMQTWWHPSRAALISSDSFQSLWGVSLEGVRQTAREADALLTIAICGQREPPELLADIRPRILVDQDPGYTHLWSQISGSPEEIFGVHDLYCTVGVNIGTPRCALPTFGWRWVPVWNPVVLDFWEPNAPIVRDHFTTIADWWGQNYLEFEGQVLGPKREEFLMFLALPRQSGESLTLALDIPPEDADLERLAQHGWQIESPALVASPEAYVDWVTGSRGEFSCAKGVYVGTGCGWFSDRSACYLAAGRPVVVQETGFSDVLPTGEGLFAVHTPAEATEAFQAIRRDYARHSKAARRLAAEYFDAAQVLPHLLAEAVIAR
jgi:hypothetical protein